MRKEKKTLKKKNHGKEKCIEGKDVTVLLSLLHLG
jgi:hypothetical protein